MIRRMSDRAAIMVAAAVFLLSVGFLAGGIFAAYQLPVWIPTTCEEGRLP